MSLMIAACGINCGECPAFKATRDDSDELRESTAKEWSVQFKSEIAPSDINCLGCHNEDSEKLFAHCRVCEIRKCAKGKGFVTCAECSEFGCDLVKPFWDYDSSFKKNLESLRK